ncbi:MAG: hypothetical protein CMF52_03580 [Legionellales bacterium]|nr:hypothetical protein [Legionellales bacterium]
MSQLNYKPNSCRNCGHPSHCGYPLWLENKNYQDGWDTYCACKKCRCDVCTPPTPKTDIPTSMLNGL